MSAAAVVDTATIYELTTAILGTASLIMGITLFLLSKVLTNNGIRSKSGLKFLSAALLVLSIINLLEYIAGVDSQKEWHSLCVVVVAASLELMLIFMAYMSMLCSGFATRKRICFEFGCVVLLTTPSLFVSPENHPILFNVLFGIGIAFFCTKFLCNYVVYRRQIKITKQRVENLLSDHSDSWLKWISHSFYVILAIGITSIAAPMTNLTVLVFYNIFILCAYFYVYISVIQKISIFDKRMTTLEDYEVESFEQNGIETPAFQGESDTKLIINVMDSRQKLIDHWIANKGYTVASITAAEVAAHLTTNRTKLSFYLKNTLNTTYYNWIAQLRIEEAKRQLIEYPDRSISEIAFNVGIEDRDNFRHLFIKIVGLSPTAYRKRGRH